MASLAEALGFEPNDGNNPALIDRFKMVVACCEKRFLGPSFITPQTDAIRLQHLWLNLRGKLDYGEELGIFPLNIQNGDELRELNTLYTNVKDFKPITPAIRETIDFALLCRRNGATLSDDEKRILTSLETQLANTTDNATKPTPLWIQQCAFISPAELSFINELRKFEAEFGESWATKKKTPDARIELGRTNIGWKLFNGRWEPAFLKGRYNQSTLVNLSAKYIESCLEPDRLPRSPAARAEQATILRMALRVKNKEISVEEFLTTLRNRYPPPAKDAPI